MHRRFAQDANVGPGMTGSASPATYGNPWVRIGCCRSKCHSIMAVLASRRRRTVREVIAWFGDHRHPKEGTARGVAGHTSGRNPRVVHRRTRPKSRRCCCRPSVAGTTLCRGNGDMVHRLCDRRQPIMTIRRRAGGGRRDRR